MISLHFFHTNDIHSHFDHWANLVTFLNRERRGLRAEGQPYLTLDLGDHMDRANPLTEGLLGEGNVKLLNDAGYDFVTIGNNEGITFTKNILNAVYSHRRFTVVLANLYDTNGKRPDWCRPYVIHNMNGVRVGLVGLTAAFDKFYRQLDWDIRDPFTELSTIVEKIKPETDIIVLLSHVGLPFDERVAREVNGIDLILGAHTHHVLKHGLVIGKTLIVQAGKFCRYAGRAVLDYDEEQRRVVHKTAELIPLTTPPDESAGQEVCCLKKEGIAHMQHRIAVLDHEMPVSWFQETEATRLMADALRKWCHAEIGMVNAGVILEGLHAGPVTRYDIHRICPHPINPCKVSVTGREIVQMVNTGLDEAFQTYALKGFGFRGKMLGKLIFSHLTYQNIKKDGTPQAEDVRVNGRPIRLEKEYSVGTIDVFTFGTFLLPVVKAKQQFFLPETLRDLLAWRLTQIR
ncbi:bifunctional metallophosphatase/5'-nucleotidase [Sporolactobacillus sp. THM7-7]|nr:bifunctional metallophosphatase/5'-nucleotidase [Sporolactobacillus sp. THM7-7]